MSCSTGNCFKLTQSQSYWLTEDLFFAWPLFKMSFSNDSKFDLVEIFWSVALIIFKQSTVTLHWTSCLALTDHSTCSCFFTSIQSSKQWQCKCSEDILFSKTIWPWHWPCLTCVETWPGEKRGESNGIVITRWGYSWQRWSEQWTQD